MKSMIEAGAAGIHFEDQLASEKKCGHLGGKVLVPTQSFIRTLDWRSGLSLFSHDVKKDSSFDLQNNMGVELFRAGKFDQAKKYFENNSPRNTLIVNMEVCKELIEHKKLEECEDVVLVDMDG